MNQATSLNQLTQPKQRQNVAVGFTSEESFELVQRMAKMFSSSSLVPTQYQAVSPARGNSPAVPNPNALANCAIAINMAARLQADPIMVMQNLYIIEGRPSWSSQWIIAAINSCGRYTSLRFDIEHLGEKTVEFTSYEWNNNTRRKEAIKKSETIQDMRCVAWATEISTGTRLESSPVTIELAVKEGWYSKNGSKWQTMPETMIRYRAAAFFGRIYAPELLMGLKTQEESEDIEYIEVNAQGDVEVATTTVKKQAEKVITPDADVIDVAPEAKPEPKAESQENQAQDGTLESESQGGQSQMSLDDDFPL